jgi:hypothetical protein
MRLLKIKMPWHIMTNIRDLRYVFYVYYCFNGISMFARSFPPLDKAALREIWTQKVRDGGKGSDWIPNNFTKICSLHFHPDELILKTSGYVYIASGAVPNIPEIKRVSIFYI